MKKLFQIIAILSFIWMIVFMVLQLLPLYMLCAILLVWSALVLIIDYLEPKIEEANKHIKQHYEDDNYYPDQSF